MQDDEGRQPAVTWQRPVAGTPDVAEAVAELVRVAFGVVALGAAVALRSVDPAAAVPEQRSARAPASELTDLVVGTAWAAARLSGRVAATGGRVGAPVVSLVLRPPIVPRRLHPGEALTRMVEQWRRDRPDTVRSLAQWSSTTVPVGITTALRQVDAKICIDAFLDGVDIDEVVAGVVRRMDVDAAVALVLARLDLAAASAAALDQLDLTQLVIDRVDLERVVTGVLTRMDLTALVLEQLDFGQVIEAALKQVDLTQVVVDQVDLIGVAEYVVAGIDLPEIIRSSTGSVASESVRGLRMQGVGADQAVSRAVDRVLFRRAGRRPATDAVPWPEPRAPETEDRP